MATKRKSKKSKARRKKAGLKVRVIDLKKVGGNLTKLKSALKKASRGKVCLVVRNAPFKLAPAQAAS
jgi:hypothetical protein